MARFINMKLHSTVVDSGETTGDAADKLTQSGQNFEETVKVGDIVVDSDGVVYNVLAVDSDTVLSVDNGGVPDETTFVIYSGSITTDRLFSVENLMYTLKGSEFNTIVKYDHLQSNVDRIIITHQSDSSTENVVDSINNLVNEIFSGTRSGEVLSTLNTDVKLITAKLPIELG
jgi:hypothetical protein